MATRPAEAEQQTQEGIAALIAPMLARAWTLVETQELTDALPRLREIVQALVDRYGGASAAQAVEFVEQLRQDAGVPGDLRVPPVDDPAPGHVDQVVDAATRSLWRPEGFTGTFVPDEELALRRVNEDAQRLVLDQGRQQVITAVEADRQANGWVRETEPGACSFCLMLAIRSATYRMYSSRRAAGRRSNFKVREGGLPFVGEGEFKVHNHCRCVAVPVFGVYEAPARIREAAQLWNESTKGRSGKDARAAFRQAVEGRPVTGLKGERHYAAPTPAKQRTPEQLSGELKVLEGLPPAKTSAAAEYRRKRIALLRKQLAAHAAS